jgi:outer membrane protein
MSRFCILLLCCLAGHVSAQDTLSLDQAIRLCLAQSPGLQKLKLDKQINQEKVAQERANLLPQIAAQVNLDYLPILPTTLIPGALVNRPGDIIPTQFGEPWQTSSQLTINQLLFQEAYRKAAPAKPLAAQFADLSEEKTKEQLVFDLVNLYLQVQQTQASYATLAAHEVRLITLEKSVRASVSNGFSIGTDLRKIELAKQTLLGQRQNLNDALDYQKALLGLMMGAPLDSATVLGSNGFGPVQSVQQKAEPSSIDVKLLETGIALQEVRIRSTAAQRYPSLHAYATGLIQTQRPNPNFFSSNYHWYGMGAVGLKVQVPIMDGGRLKSQVRQNRFEIEKLQLDKQQLTQLKAIELNYAQKQVDAAQVQYQLKQASVKLASDVYEQLKKQHLEGVIPLVDLLDAQTALAEAETQVAVQEIAVKLAWLKVLRVGGGLLAR